MKWWQHYRLASFPYATLYHGSPASFTEFKTYEARFTPFLPTALGYAKKNGFVYEFSVSETFPLNRVILVPTVLTPKEYGHMLADFKGCARVHESKKAFEAREGSIKNVASSWDDFLGTFCELEGVQGVWLPKYEHQVMLCRATVQQSLVLKQRWPAVSILP